MKQETEKWGDGGIKPRLWKLPVANYFVPGFWFSNCKIEILFTFALSTHKIYCDKYGRKQMKISLQASTTMCFSVWFLLPS